MATEPQQEDQRGVPEPKKKCPRALSPGPEIAVPDPWRYSIGANSLARGAYKLQGSGQSGMWVWLAPLPYVTEVVIKRDGQGSPLDHLYRITMDPASALSVLCSRRDIQRGIWASKLGVALSLDDKVIRAVGTAILSIATDAPWVEAVPGWSETSLHLPSGQSSPNGYGLTIGTEDDARTCWQESADLLARPGCEKAALYVGAGIFAPFVRRFDRASAIWHSCGRSSGGKTTCIISAAATVGPPDRTKRSWSASPMAVAGGLLKFGCMPVFRDEAARLGARRPREMESLIFDITEGGDRERTNRETGETYTNGTWYGFLLSTGNDSLLDMATDNGGLNARVIELKAPLTDSAETSDRLIYLARQAAGWPLAWLREMNVQDVWGHVAQAERDLGAETLSGVPRRIALVLAGGVAGASLLEEMTGGQGVRASALRAALDALEELAAEAAELAVSPGDRLLGAILEAMASEPGSFPAREVYTSSEPTEQPLRAVMGVRYAEGAEQRIAVFNSKMKTIAEAAGMTSPRTGLRDLKEQGLLVPEEYESRAGLTRREYLGPRHGRVTCYVIRRPADDPTPRITVGPSDAVAGRPLAPMPPTPTHLRPEQTPSDVPDPVETFKGATEDTAPSESSEASKPVPQARTSHASTRRRLQLAEVRAVTAGSLFDPRSGEFTALEGPGAEGDLVALVTAAATATGSHEVTLVLDREAQDEYGLTGPRPGLTKPWHKAFQALVDAGWHQPRKVGQRPRVQQTTTLEHPDHGGLVRITAAGWLRAGEFPAGPKGDDAASGPELAQRLARYAELVGWSFTGTAANTAIWALRQQLDATRKSFVRMIPEHSPQWPTWQAADSWARDLTSEEKRLGFVVGYDAVKCYLPAYKTALIAGAELVHDQDPVFDEKMAGLWLMVVPEWPHPLVPAPVHEVPAGKSVWVTTAIIKMYVETGINPEVTEAWIAPAIAFQGFRLFADQLRDGLKVVEAHPDDADERAVRDAMKATYRTLHGKLRNDDQQVIARPDWGYAVRDAAWTGILRKVYRSAGLLGDVDQPRYPVAVDTDEIVYPTHEANPRLAVPAGLKLAPEGQLPDLGQFRPKTAMTTDEWEATHA